MEQYPDHAAGIDLPCLVKGVIPDKSGGNKNKASGSITNRH